MVIQYHLAALEAYNGSLRGVFEVALLKCSWLAMALRSVKKNTLHESHSIKQIAEKEQIRIGLKGQGQLRPIMEMKKQGVLL